MEKASQKVAALSSTLSLSLSLSLSREQRDQKKIAKCCPKIISLEKLKILTPSQKLPKNVVDLGKLLVAKGFKKLPIVQ